MKQAVILVALCFVVGTLQAQQGDPAQIVITPDEDAVLLESQLQQRTDPSGLRATREYAAEKIEVRKFDDKRWREVVGGHQYNDAGKKQKPPPQKREQESRSGSGFREAESDDDAPGYDDESSVVYLGWLGPIARLFFYGAIIAIIATILYQVVRNTSWRFNPKKKTADAPKNPDDVHDITELDTETLLKNAHASGNYKLAIRLYFLHLLKKLNENGSIAWTKDKTNRDYLSELFSKQYYFDEVRKLTVAYERVWYGEHVPTAETYQELSSEFRAIDQKLNAASRS